MIESVFGFVVGVDAKCKICGCSNYFVGNGKDVLICIKRHTIYKGVLE
jgi:hypothetical protein